MYKRLIIISFIKLLSIYSFAQKPYLNWEKCIGGTKSELKCSIELADDSGLILVGETESNDGDILNNFGIFDYFITKIDKNGNIVWKKSMGGNSIDTPLSITKTIDNNYVILGTSSSTNGDFPNPNFSNYIWVTKITENGDILWNKNFVGITNHSIYATNDGGCIISEGGWYSNNLTIKKISSDGDLLWSKPLLHFDNSSLYKGSANFLPTKDNGYIVIGQLQNTLFYDATHVDIHIVKYDSNGNLQWRKTFGGSAPDYPKSIFQLNDGNYIFYGTTKSNDGDITNFHGFVDIWVVKINQTGDIIWQKAMGGSGNEYASCIIELTDNNLLLSGYTSSLDGQVSENNGDHDIWVVKLNYTGTIIWKKTYGGNSFEEPFDILEIQKSNFYISGRTYSNNLDVNGNHGGFDFWQLKIKECFENENIVNDISTNLDVSVSDYIQANNKINPNTIVNFNAGKKIILNNGFETKNGSVFSAFIEGCGNN